MRKILEAGIGVPSNGKIRRNIEMRDDSGRTNHSRRSGPPFVVGDAKAVTIREPEFVWRGIAKISGVFGKVR
jgi:hypothetical protein